MYELRTHKNSLRAEYREKRAALPKEMKEACDEKICALFMSLVTYRYADVLLMYAPLPDEINVMPLAEAALKGGKRICFPRCSPKDRSMVFCYVEDISQLESGIYGIREPMENLRQYRSGDAEHPVCLIPGILFDHEGYRLGYGKGYYDRYLPGFGGTKVGLIYSEFLLDAVPRGRFDLSVDLLVTEKGVKALHAN